MSDRPDPTFSVRATQSQVSRRQRFRALVWLIEVIYNNIIAASAIDGWELGALIKSYLFPVTKQSKPRLLRPIQLIENKNNVNSIWLHFS